MDIKDNNKIYDINFLKNTLEKLDVSGKKCGIRQEGIEQLTKLKILNANDNENINDINFAKNTLEILYASSDSGITQKGIEELKKLN